MHEDRSAFGLGSRTEGPQSQRNRCRVRWSIYKRARL